MTTSSRPAVPAPETAPAARAENSFAFDVRAPFGRVAPLLGGWGERVWAGDDWKPRFLYPHPARDEEGEVFTLDHDLGEATWVNTVFDLAAGRFQYVYVIPRVLATSIDIRAAAAGAERTRVEATYRRTALDPRHDADVEALGLSDRIAGEEWRTRIEAVLLPASGAQMPAPAAGAPKEG